MNVGHSKSQDPPSAVLPRNAGRTNEPDFGSDTRGVQWTLEAFLAVLLLLASLVVVTAVLPVGTQQTQVEVDQAQLQKAGEDVLRLAEVDGLLRETLLYWNTSSGRFVDTQETVSGHALYTSMAGVADHPMGPLLRKTLEENDLSYNIHVNPVGGSGAASQRSLVYNGPPGSNSVVASTTVLLRDSDIPAGTVGGCPLGELDESGCSDEQFYTENAEPNTSRFAVVTVRLEIWQG